MKSVLSGATIFAALFGALLVQEVSASSQCSSKVAANLSKFALVFSGQVIHIESQPSLIYVTFRVERIWKGELMEEVQVLLPQGSVWLGNQGVFSARGLKKFKLGESYMVYAFGGEIHWNAFMASESGGVEQNYITTKCTPTKRFKDANKDLELLGEGFAPANAPATVERFDLPILRESRSTIRFPGNYRVTLKAYGPEGYTLVLHGYLTQEVKLLGGLKRLKEDSDDLSEPISEDVVVGLRTGEEAGFITPSQIEDNFDYPFDFEIESTRVQDKPLTKFYAQGDVADGKLRSLSNGNGELTSVELYDLAKGFRLTISWSKVTEH